MTPRTATATAHPSRLPAASTFLAVVLLAPPALAAPPGAAAAGLVQLLALIVLLLGLGFGLGAFGLTVNNLFRRRAEITFEVMRRRPKLALATGIAVTLLGLGLLAVLRGAPPLQLLVLLCYLGFLAQFALACAARLVGQYLEPSLLAGELPGARAHVKGGVLLTAVNAVPILGSCLFLGILLTGIGASLLGYFAVFRKAPNKAPGHSAAAPAVAAEPGPAPTIPAEPAALAPEPQPAPARTPAPEGSAPE